VLVMTFVPSRKKFNSFFSESFYCSLYKFVNVFYSINLNEILSELCCPCMALKQIYRTTKCRKCMKISASFHLNNYLFEDCKTLSIALNSNLQTYIAISGVAQILRNYDKILLVISQVLVSSPI